ncbi:MAG: hypothetical protein AB4372_37355 [Xenococcus sp. (in: cyanobacteria)]
MVEKIAFHSIGGVEGLYLPSQSNPKYGSLLTDYGIFPAETSKQVRQKFPKIAGHPIESEKGDQRFRFTTWVMGTEKPPYYKLDLRLIRLDFPDWIKHDNWFYLQGIIAERTPERVLLRMQQNYWQNYSEAKIQASINYLQILNCPSNVRKSQFWNFTASFRDGFLHCLTADRLADATETKKILKSWQTEPIHCSQSEELLKK